MITTQNHNWLLLLLLAIAVTQVDAKKRVVHEIRRWESTGIVNCTAFEFTCKNDTKTVHSISKRCDGTVDCYDKSDERKCTECRTPFSINGTDGYLECLTAAKMRAEDTEWKAYRDTIYPKCEVNARAQLKKTWKSGCADSETRCSLDSTCLSSKSICDGRSDCDWKTDWNRRYDYYQQRYVWDDCETKTGGEDEKDCTECTNGARFCAATSKCISSTSVCDGRRDCEDGSDEKDCTCAECSGSRALCGSGQCIDGKQVCDGIIDCEDASDEQNCPNACGVTITANTTLPTLVTDGRYRYLASEACSGAFSEVREKCPDNGCDCNVAFQCSYNQCIPKAKVCDGVKDCYSGKDEENCLSACSQRSHFTCMNKYQYKCLPIEHKCDGVWDCTDGSDEKKCDKCPATAHKCDGGCLPGSKRCDGVKDCKDGSDEKNCTCEECIEGHLDTYSCEATGTCLKRSAACGPRSRCPNATARDELFCIRQSQRTAKQRDYKKDYWYYKGEPSRYWD